MFEIIKNRELHKHLFFAIVTLFFLFFVWLKYLDYHTLHNNYIQVPDFNGKVTSQLDSIANANDIRFEISDTIFSLDIDRGVVVNQDPQPLVNVKRDRKIYLTINSTETKKVSFPNIFDLSLRQSIRKLKNIGLEVGELEYRANIATNKVLDYKVNGINISIGQELYIGTIIDLVVGQGNVSSDVLVPDLIGLTRTEANIILKSVSLNIGSEIFNSVIDSSSAIVYRQSPLHNSTTLLKIGSSVDLFFNEGKYENL